MYFTKQEHERKIINFKVRCTKFTDKIQKGCLYYVSVNKGQLQITKLPCLLVTALF